jgi:sterol desaturase/sphingolipid hydroxylase (fatty acid hydroxylase superfamily)
MYMERLSVLFAALLVLSVLFGLIETLFPANAEQPRWRGRKGLRTDLVYWFLTPLFTKVLSNVGVVIILVLLYRQAPLELRAMLDNRDTLLGRQPLWLQALEMLLIGDFIAYWVHRAFHGTSLWPIHAVHHSSEHLDWLASVRFHPFNDWIARWSQACALVLLGFTPTAVAAYIPFIQLFAIFLHANVSWDFGPLRKVIASPRFHRWHHTSEEEGLDKNFAGLFPFYDALFGTWYMPEGKVPQRFGLNNESVPDGFFPQLLYPFRRKPRPEKAGALSARRAPSAPEKAA